MKKALLPAIITAVLATSAQAANLYQTDGTVVSLSGEVDAIYHRLDAAAAADDVNGEINSWANVQLDVVTKVSDSVNAMASFEVEATDGEEVKVDDAWLGFKGDFGTITLGETGSSYEVLEKAQLVNEGDDYDVAYSDGEDSGHSIRYQKDIGPVALSANYFSNESATDDDGFALSADYAVGDFTIGAAYIENDSELSAMGISASMAMDALYVAATYTYNEDGADNFDTAAFSTSYAFDGIATVYGSYQIQDGDSKDIKNWYVGISHDITANIYAFVEYIDNEEDNVDKSDLFAGIYYSF